MPPLEDYRDKRRAAATPEPFGAGQSRPFLFVVQKHGARRLHYDFRLEYEGVLLSWAIPKGPSFDPDEKRFAVQTEDHPVEYADFEGIIPDGNYGAGAVIVWDQGRWTPLEDPKTGMQKGKLLFELSGHKLRGVWTLVRTKSERGSKAPSKDWLLIKKPDGWASKDPARAPDELSIFSGLDLEEVASGSARLQALNTALIELGAVKASIPSPPPPMLAEAWDVAFDDPAWIYELKYDGFRLLIERQGAQARLFYRSGHEATALYPELVRAAQSLPYEHLVLDGELVVLGADARPSFQRLQKRAKLSRAQEIVRAAVNDPVVFYGFDLLAAQGHDLRNLPLVERKRLLQQVLPKRGPLRYLDHIPEKGRALFAQVEAMGLEGVVGKKAQSPYRDGRSDEWRKIRTERSEDFIVVGYSLPQGSRTGIGALHLGRFVDEALTYVGRVGTGFTDTDLRTFAAELDPTRIDAAALAGPVPTSSGHVWVEPRLVVEVRFKERTDEGLLRLPVYLRTRRDKTPKECRDGDVSSSAGGAAEAGTGYRAEGAGQGGASGDAPSGPGGSMNGSAGDAPAPSTIPAPERREVSLTNLDKVFWPGKDYRKGDLLSYYRGVAPWLLPYLRDRPLVLTRFPDGIDGKSFFQKDAPVWSPDWVRTVRVFSEDAGRDIDYFICDSVESLLFIINLGTIPLHVWASRVQDPSRPDWTIIDLDPKGASFANVIRLALAAKKLCEEVGLPSFLKTSGASGLHVLVPLGGQTTFEQGRILAHILSQLLVSRHPDIATLERVIGKRQGKVYLDYLQNGHGKLLVAPFSARPVPEASVSMPLAWDAIESLESPARFELRSAVPHLEAHGDPMATILTLRPDLGGALQKLLALAT